MYRLYGMLPFTESDCELPLQSAGKGQRGNLVRCGQCHMCRNPLMKKPCLHPIVPRGLDGLDEGPSAPTYGLVPAGGGGGGGALLPEAPVTALAF